MEFFYEKDRNMDGIIFTKSCNILYFDYKVKIFKQILFLNIFKDSNKIHHIEKNITTHEMKKEFKNQIN